MCVLRRLSSSSHGANVPAGNPANVAEQRSLFDMMDVDMTSTSASAADVLDVRGNSSRRDVATHSATQQSKRPAAAAGSSVTEHDDDRSSKRQRQNSTANTESSSSMSSVPADRSPINASYCSMLRYRTRVTVSCFLFLSLFCNNSWLYLVTV